MAEIMRRGRSFTARLSEDSDSIAQDFLSHLEKLEDEVEEAQGERNTAQEQARELEKERDALKEQVAELEET